jgi:hypothetical protein
LRISTDLKTHGVTEHAGARKATKGAQEGRRARQLVSECAEACRKAWALSAVSAAAATGRKRKAHGCAH